MIYTIKTALIIAILLSFYLFFLEKEKMHRFNRFYLLGGLMFAFVIPLITIATVPVNPEAMLVAMPAQVVVPSILKHSEVPVSINYMEWIKIGYIAVACLLLLRLVYNLLSIAYKITSKPKLRLGNNKIVLVSEETVPYTFLNYMFVNAEEYEMGAIDEQLFTHEFTHANQWHTLDILFIEIVTICHWFNPLLYFYKKAIQLNHEFLADQAVNTRHNAVTSYQNLLLEKSSLNSGYTLSSNFNFQVTKKRLMMMTKDTSKVKKLMYSIVVFPMIAILISCFGEYQMKHSPELIQKGDGLISVDFRGMTEDQLYEVQKELSELDIQLIYMREDYTGSGLIDKLSFEVKVPSGNSASAEYSLGEMPAPIGFYYDIESGESGVGGVDRNLHLFKKRTIKTAQEIKNLGGKFFLDGREANYAETYQWIQDVEFSFQSDINWGTDEDWDAKMSLKAY